MRYQYIKDMIFARLAGTAIHLNQRDFISYQKYRVWGIKTLIKDLVEDIFDIIYKNLPKDEELLNPEEDLLKPLKILCERYDIPFDNVLKFIEQRKEPTQIWETLDCEQQAIFIVNTFFEAFEENLVDTYFVLMSFQYPKKAQKLKRTDFGLKDFGFIYRARGYCRRFSSKIFNNGFNNTIRRLNSVLFKEYNETFVEKIKSQGVSIAPEEIINIEELPPEKQYAIEMLKHGNSKEKLEAIALINENHITEALNELEYLLNDKDEKIMNAAFDTILILKNLDDFN